jgi:hypothetical protein
MVAARMRFEDRNMRTRRRKGGKTWEDEMVWPISGRDKEKTSVPKTRGGRKIK